MYGKPVCDDGWSVNDAKVVCRAKVKVIIVFMTKGMIKMLKLFVACK